MKYKTLIEKLALLSPEQLNSDVTFLTPDGEFFAAELEIQDGDDILDDNHPYLVHNGVDENNLS